MKTTTTNSYYNGFGISINRKLFWYFKNLSLTDKSRIFIPQTLQAPERCACLMLKKDIVIQTLQK